MKIDLRYILLIATCAILAWMISSCKTVDCIPETIVRDSVRIEQKLDSIFLYEKDSIFIKEGRDTVFVEKYVTRYKDVLKVQRDTIYQDNSVVEVKEVLVEKPIAGFVKAMAWIGGGAILLVLIWIVLKVYKKFFLKV